MKYYKYIDYGNNIICYVLLDVPDKDLYKFYKTILTKVVKTNDAINFEVGVGYYLPLDRLIEIKNKKLITELDKLMVFS